MSLYKIRRNDWAHSRPLPGVRLIAVVSATALLVAGCGGSSSASSSTAKPPAATSHAAKVKPAATSKPAAKASAGALSGTWSGQYGGSYNGTFNLNWKQSGAALSGTIKLSTPSSTMSIHGTTNGGAIRFGTVGGVAITYSGTVSGDSMSGNYNTPAGGGSWSANKG
jgi:hypothetical protein